MRCSGKSKKFYSKRQGIYYIFQQKYVIFTPKDTENQGKGEKVWRIIRLQ